MNHLVAAVSRYLATRSAARAARRVRILEVVHLGSNVKLAVALFDGRELLLGISKDGIAALAEQRG